jgi:hypothetical protein
MGDDLQREVIDARQSGGWSLEQARQLPAVALGEMSLGGADLIFDQIKIVEQPFAGRRDPGSGPISFEPSALLFG